METEKRPKGRPKGINFPVKKIIKITEAQNKKWNSDTPKQVRAFLDGSPTEKLRRLYDIMNAWMIGKMNNDQIKNIPESVKEEIKEIEGILNVHDI